MMAVVLGSISEWIVWVSIAYVAVWCGAKLSSSRSCILDQD